VDLSGLRRLAPLHRPGTGTTSLASLVLAVAVVLLGFVVPSPAVASDIGVGGPAAGPPRSAPSLTVDGSGQSSKGAGSADPAKSYLYDSGPTRAYEHVGALSGSDREVSATNEGAIPAGSTADAATSGSRITPSVRGQYFQEGAEPPTCSYCQQNPAEHLDHVIPRSQGGDLTPENMTPACEWCNLSKGARVAPVNPPAGYVGEWPPSFWPQRMRDWWMSTYGGSS
jgi:hypothetical protein